MLEIKKKLDKFNSKENRLLINAVMLLLALILISVIMYNFEMKSLAETKKIKTSYDLNISKFDAENLKELFNSLGVFDTVSRKLINFRANIRTNNEVSSIIMDLYHKDDKNKIIRYKYDDFTSKVSVRIIDEIPSNLLREAPSVEEFIDSIDLFLVTDINPLNKKENYESNFVVYLLPLTSDLEKAKAKADFSIYKISGTKYRRISEKIEPSKHFLAIIKSSNSDNQDFERKFYELEIF